MALTLTACGSAGHQASSAAASASSAKSNTLVYGSGDYTRINPALDEHGEINALLFDGLTGHDKDNQVVPRLAESWELDKDTNTYTFHLRQDVTWHDGEIHRRGRKVHHRGHPGPEKRVRKRFQL